MKATLVYSPQVASCKQENILSVAASILKKYILLIHNFNKIQHIPVSFFLLWKNVKQDNNVLEKESQNPFYILFY